MNVRLLGCILFATAFTTSAHRLDEYLQATRIAVATNRIDISIELTPGVAVVSEVLAAINTNHDAQLSDSERQTYGERLLKDIRVGIDDRPVTLLLAQISFPAIQEMKEGHGIIRVKASADIAPLQPGAHTLTLTNSHLPKVSVYLVNALVPKDRTIQIRKQARDEWQRDYRLQFTVDPSAR
jgi:hypothetical protein